MITVPKTHFDDIRANFANIGVRQYGDAVLRQKAKRIALPAETTLASEVLDCLLTTIKAARTLHDFSRGIGLAAPQIGILRRIAVVQPVGVLPLRMINPQLVEASRKTAVDFEGCLSFFDYRGEVRRPVEATIRYQDLSGQEQSLHLKGDAARLALHELDHLDGRLYIDRMDANAQLIEADDSHP